MHHPGAERKHFFMVAKRLNGPAEATTERAFAWLRNQAPEARIRNLSALSVSCALSCFYY